MAVAVDAVSTDSTTGGNLSWSHTVTGATLSFLQLMGQRFGTNGVTGGTFNAVSLTKLFEFDNGMLTSSIVYRLLAPATGAHTSAVVQADSRAIAATGLSLTGVDQTTPEGTLVSATGHDTNPTVTVASAVNDLVVDCLSWYMPAGETVTVGAGQTQRSNQTVSTMGVAVSTQAGAASVVMDWTASADVYWNLVAIPIKAGGAGAGGSPLSAALQFAMGDGG